jgi:uncharacterized membrane protein YjgN (DUF898 family)
MNQLQFCGKSSAFLKIVWADFLLVILTLTLYYPKAMIREMGYLYSQTYLGDAPFRYTATYKSYLKWYLKALLGILLSLLLFGGVFFLLAKGFEDIPQAVNFVYIILYISYLFLIIPLILFGSMKFHLGHTCWKTAQMDWQGKLRAYLPLHFLGNLLTLLTLGFYSPWQVVRLNKYFLSNLHFGSLNFDFCGNAKDLFKFYWKGLLFGILTLGIYSIWNYKARFNYTVSNIMVRKGEHEFKLYSNANTLEVFEMLLGNFIIVLLTLGFGTPWAYIRYIRFIVNHCTIPESFNLDLIEE